MGNFQKDKGVVGWPHPPALLGTELKAGQPEWAAAIAEHIILAKGTAYAHGTCMCTHMPYTYTHSLYVKKILLTAWTK